MLVLLLLAALCAFACLLFLRAPVKLVWKLLLNGFAGLVCLICLNLLSAVTGVWLPVNLFSALCVGVLGVAGVLLLFALQWLF